jgi:uncharacterized protein YeaO (DUF488 family)
MIKIQRVYERVTEVEGKRFLVDHIWPRGIKKVELEPYTWLREVAPSDELRKWFGHDPEKWNEFRHRYDAELDKMPASWQPILEASRHGVVTLLYGAKDVEHNNAVALKMYLERKI